MVGNHFNQIDVLVNNAAFWGGEGFIDQMSMEAWFSIIDQNVKGSYVITRSVISYMKQGGWGRIVHVSSHPC
ncbi:SDR family oxidoreductase [Seinonella peptonophila]|uniref:SDR family oxidoreductase n=1 Tax=Seinonella peptonophila TaxID=112248 RepID=UPI000935583C